MTRLLASVTMNVSILLAGTSALGGANVAPTRTYLAVGKHANAVHRAMRILTRIFRSEAGQGCSGYFVAKGWKVAETFSNGSTLVIFTDVELPGTHAEVFATSGKTAPWSVIYLNPKRLAEDAWPKLGDCELASLLLHELGHLARKDAVDNEPEDFFGQCKVRCLDPGKWR